ncbi:uncharacterized protein LOC142012238 [Carettochelys insculpta]|uniref:uncharacterized protein LOC142012238 n=1 Tax=Carettochelys insculpta TaxID=44489 RepID=UPI003EBA1AB3
MNLPGRTFEGSSICHWSVEGAGPASEGNDTGGWSRMLANLALETSPGLRGPHHAGDQLHRQLAAMEQRSSVLSEDSGLLAMVFASNVPARSDHQRLWQLSMATQQSLAAAACQCLGVAALCIAISNLSWIVLETKIAKHLLQRSEYWATIYVSGVPVTLRPQEWLNETGSSDIVLLTSNQWVFIHLMMGICFLSVVAGFTAFLLDFIEIKKIGMVRLIIATVLHVLSAVLCALVLVFCTWILTVIQKPSISKLLNEHHYAASLGESFYLTIAAFILSSLASIFSTWSVKLYGKDSPPIEGIEESETKESKSCQLGSQHTVTFS